MFFKKIMLISMLSAGGHNLLGMESPSIPELKKNFDTKILYKSCASFPCNPTKNLCQIKNILNQNPESRPNLKQRDRRGNTLLHILMFQPSFLNTYKEGVCSPLIAEEIIQKGNTIVAHQVEAIQLLCQAGIDPNSKNNYGMTPLHLAAMYQCPVIMQTLLDLGADPMSIDKNKNNLLHYALDDILETDSLKNIKFLIEKYPILQAQENHNHMFPIIKAIVTNNFSALKLLGQADSTMLHTMNTNQENSLHWALKSTNTLAHIEEYLLKQAVDPQCKNSEGKTALFFAISKNSVSTVEKIAQAYPDLIVESDTKKRTALEIAAYYNNTAILHLFKVINPSAFSADEQKKSFYYALMSPHASLQAITFFVDHGYAPPHQDNNALTAFMNSRFIKNIKDAQLISQFLAQQGYL